MLRSLIYAFIYYSGLGNCINMSSNRNRHYGIILAYHRISPLTTENHFLKDMIVDPASFEEQLCYLKNKYRVVSSECFLDSLNGPPELFRNLAVITFDDAYRDNYTHAFPILKKYGLPATIFIPTFFIESAQGFWWDTLAALLVNTKKKNVIFIFRDNEYAFSLVNDVLKQKAFNAIAHLLKKAGEQERQAVIRQLTHAFEVSVLPVNHPCLSWSEIQEMSKHAISFAAHSHTHQAFSSLSENQLREELLKPKEILESRLKQKVDCVAYPFGEKEDCSGHATALISMSGYRYGVTMMQGKVCYGDNQLLLKRIGIGGNDTKAIFKLKLRGIVPLIKHN